LIPGERQIANHKHFIATGSVNKQVILVRFLIAIALFFNLQRAIEFLANILNTKLYTPLFINLSLVLQKSIVYGIAL